jgi:hypothetical protein
VIVGEVTITSGQPIVRFEEKRRKVGEESVRGSYQRAAVSSVK